MTIYKRGLKIHLLRHLGFSEVEKMFLFGIRVKIVDNQAEGTITLCCNSKLYLFSVCEVPSLWNVADASRCRYIAGVFYSKYA